MRIFILRTMLSSLAQRRQLQSKMPPEPPWVEKKQAGLTLIECLVAIAVIASTIGVIAPVVVLSVATRLQNQRFEQAAQLAQAEVTKIRVMVERESATEYTKYITDRVGQADVDVKMADVGPPTLLKYEPPSPSSPLSFSTARTVDINNDSIADFVVQLFRTNNDDDGVGDTDDNNDIVMSDGQITAFKLGVRVYRYKSAKEVIDASGTLSTERAALTFTSGEGQGSTRPLAVLYADIVKSDEQESLCDYHAYAATSTPKLLSVCDP